MRMVYAKGRSDEAKERVYLENVIPRWGGYFEATAFAGFDGLCLSHDAFARSSHGRQTVAAIAVQLLPVSSRAKQQVEATL